MVCVKCSNAYHANCLKTIKYKPLVKKYIICDQHPDEPLKQPKPVKSKTAKTAKSTRITRKRVHKKDEEEEENEVAYEGSKRCRKNSILECGRFYIGENSVATTQQKDEEKKEESTGMMVEPTLPTEEMQAQSATGETTALSEHDFEL